MTPLRFRSDGTFRIVQFTDLHWHNGEEKDRQTEAMMEVVLNAERPDLVVLTGDVIAGRPCREPATSWAQVTQPMIRRETPWAAVFGNHDDEGTASRESLMESQRALPMCLSEAGPAEVSGVGNYALRVLGHAGERLAAALYFLDSGSYASHGMDGYGWITRDRIAWYAETSKRLGEEYRQARRADEVLPALAFFHIPTPEFNEVWETRPCRGEKFEEVCCPKINTGLIAAMCEAGDVRGVFVGHDHVNDYEGELHGIRLVYGRWGGYATYGAEHFTPGARVIELREGERDFRTWLRLADGSAVTEPPHHSVEKKGTA